MQTRPANLVSPDGVYIDMQELETQMMIISEPKANDYWLGQIEKDVRQIVNEWGKFIEAQIPEAQLPKQSSTVQ